MPSISDPRLVEALRNFQAKPGVMEQAPQAEWRPEYEQEPALEAPMVSPEDIIQGVPKLGAVGAKALVAALKGGALPAMAGSINSGSARSFMKKLINREQEPELYAAILRGEHPEKVMAKASEGSYGGAFMPTNWVGNKAYRYETARPLYDKGVVHYDVTGGQQIPNILADSQFGPRGGRLAVPKWNKNIEGSQIREADLSDIPEDAATFTGYDRWKGEYGQGASSKRPTLKKGEHEFYVNEIEGTPGGFGYGMPEPSIRDILNDPDLRYEYNLSLAAPSDSKFHTAARILRSK